MTHFTQLVQNSKLFGVGGREGVGVRLPVLPTLLTSIDVNVLCNFIGSDVHVQYFIDSVKFVPTNEILFVCF